MNGDIELVKAIHTGFDLEELKTLCFQMGVDYDDLAGQNRLGKCRELVEWCDRKGLTVALIMTCAAERPNNDYWSIALSRIPAEDAQLAFPKLCSTATSKLKGWQIAQLTSRINHADVDRARLKVMVAADLALTSYLVLHSILN
jgi:hypothetical protein